MCALHSCSTHIVHHIMILHVHRVPITVVGLDALSGMGFVERDHRRRVRVSVLWGYTKGYTQQYLNASYFGGSVYVLSGPN